MIYLFKMIEIVNVLLIAFDSGDNLHMIWDILYFYSLGV